MIGRLAWGRACLACVYKRSPNDKPLGWLSRLRHTFKPIHQNVTAFCRQRTAAAGMTISNLQDRVLFVTDLPRNITSEDVVTALHNALPTSKRIEVGGYKSANYVHPRGCKHKGFAYVLIGDESELEKAFASLSTLQLGDKPLKVERAVKLPNSWTTLLQSPQQDSTGSKDADAKRQKSREHNQRYRQREVQRHVAHLQELLVNLSDVGDHSYQPLLANTTVAAGLVDWVVVPAMCDPALVQFGSFDFRCRSPSSHSLPASAVNELQDDTTSTASAASAPGLTTECQPGHGGMLNERNLRKRTQVESFALILHQLLMFGDWGGTVRPRVVDFGCGTGNLVLPLAAMFPFCDFRAVDMKARCVEILQERAAAAGIHNITASVGTIEQCDFEFDVAMALHACGSATDYAMLQAIHHRAAYIVSPCCVGKIIAIGGGADAPSDLPQETITSVCGLPLRHPRSDWLAAALPPPVTASFQLVAQAADYSHRQQHSHAELAVLAKTCIELDRNQAASEAGYATALLKLLRPELTTKSDVLVGVAVERVGKDFAWPWQLVTH